MTNLDLAASYLLKARKRLRVLDVLLEEDDFSDVIREAQELVELSQKGMLRRVGIDPPKWHDVGGIILQHLDRFPESLHADLRRCTVISKRLRKERELAFYGDIDFIPSEEYSREDALEGIDDARFLVELADRVIGPKSP